MSVVVKRIGANTINQSHCEDTGEWITTNDILQTWTNSISYVVENAEKSILGLRNAQLGALFAIKAHWTVSEEPAKLRGCAHTLCPSYINETPAWARPSNKPG